MSGFDFLLNRLRTQSPEKYKAFMAIRNSGRSPIEVMGDMYRKGELSDAQLDQTANMMSRFGYKVPKNEIAKIKAGGREQPQPQPTSIFKGLF